MFRRAVDQEFLALWSARALGSAVQWLNRWERLAPFSSFYFLPR